MGVWRTGPSRLGVATDPGGGEAALPAVHATSSSRLTICLCQQTGNTGNNQTNRTTHMAGIHPFLASGPPTFCPLHSHQRWQNT